MHFNRIGCRLHNRLRRPPPRIHPRALFFCRNLSSAPEDIFPPFFPRSFFFFEHVSRPRKRSRFFVRLGEKFRTNDRIWFIFADRSNFATTNRPLCPSRRTSVRDRPAVSAMRGRWLRERIVSITISCRARISVDRLRSRESDDDVGDTRDTCRFATRKQMTRHDRLEFCT